MKRRLVGSAYLQAIPHQIYLRYRTFYKRKLNAALRRIRQDIEKKKEAGRINNSDDERKAWHEAFERECEKIDPQVYRYLKSQGAQLERKARAALPQLKRLLRAYQEACHAGVLFSGEWQKFPREMPVQIRAKHVAAGMIWNKTAFLEMLGAKSASRRASWGSGSTEAIKEKTRWVRARHFFKTRRQQLRSQYHRLSEEEMAQKIQHEAEKNFGKLWAVDTVKRHMYGEMT